MYISYMIFWIEIMYQIAMKYNTKVNKAIWAFFIHFCHFYKYIFVSNHSNPDHLSTNESK